MKRVDRQCENEDACTIIISGMRKSSQYFSPCSTLKLQITSHVFLQAISCTRLQQFCFRNSSLSILINDKWFRRRCDTDDL